jgi:hypothetical protein
MDTTYVESFRELLNAWNLLMECVRLQFPEATNEEVYRITRDAMNRVVGLG